MYKVLNMGSSGLKQNSYGNIQRIGNMSDGRIVYRVIDSTGEETGKLSVPNNEADTFESAYRDVMVSAPKIQKFVLENSSEKDIKKRRTLSRVIVGAGGLIGGASALFLAQKVSTVKQILSTVAGIIAGLTAGFAASLAITTPPGTYKFAKASRTFSKLDIQPVIDDK